MEPVNKAQTHQSENAFKTNANSANLLGCPGCDDMRAYAQANCCRVFYPSFPRCRGCLDICEDVAFQQPCFFNPQFLPSFFHNGSISQNYCCNHGGISTNLNSESSIRDQVNHECGKIRRPTTSHTFCQKMTKKSVREKNVSDNEPGQLPQCQNQAKERNHQPCNCRESFFWGSNPFIIPVMSYCVLWNPQNAKENCWNYSCSKMENLNCGDEAEEGDVLSNTESNEKVDEDADVENEYVQDCPEYSWSQKETRGEHKRSNSSFLSVHSSGHDENKTYNVKKKNSNSSANAESDANSEEEAPEKLQIRYSGSSSNSQNQLSVKSNENVLSNTVDYSDIYSGENESQRSSTAGSAYDVKGEDSSAEVEEVDDQTEGLDGFSEERNVHISPKSSLESFEEKKSVEYNGADTESCNSDLKTKPKILIKNFTVTNRTESIFQGTTKILGAGGDLGGDHCVGFKVNIEPEETELEDTMQGTKQNYEIKRIPLKVFDEKKPNSPVEKLTTDTKVVRNSRTGIARLIQDSKSRDANMDIIKNINSECKESDSNDTKRRHLQMTEENPKFQKPSRTTMQHKTGPERQNPTLNVKNKLPRKEKKFVTPKVRPHNCERNSRK